VHETPVSARIYHEVLKKLAESIGNFRRKARMFSIFGGGNHPHPPLNREALQKTTLQTRFNGKLFILYFIII